MITTKIHNVLFVHFQYNSAKGIKLFTKNHVIPFNKCRNITPLPSVRTPNSFSQYSGYVPQVQKIQATGTKNPGHHLQGSQAANYTDISFFTWSFACPHQQPLKWPKLSKQFSLLCNYLLVQHSLSLHTTQWFRQSSFRSVA